MYQQYDKAAETVLNYLIEKGFSRTPRKDFIRATREFRRYLEERRLEYSYSIAMAWVETLKSSLPRRGFFHSGGPLP